MTNNEIIKALECCKKDDCDNCSNDFGNCYANLAGYALDIINRQNAEIDNLKIENQSLRSAANSYKIHYNKVVNDFEEFAQRAYIDNPFACQYCIHSVADGRACLWKEEHEKDGESCLGKHFKYDSNKMVGDTK